MKNIIRLLLCFVSLASFGQQANVDFDGANWKAPYTLAIPFGWGVERSLIQKEFAPQVPFKGVEDVRYAPGWGNAESEQYWSYGFLWYLDEPVEIGEEMIERNLNAYYAGLLNRNIDKQNIPTRKILPVKTWVTAIAPENGDLQTYYGAIAMLDYMEQKPIALNCLVHVKSLPDQNKTFLFFEVSPQPLNDKIWKSLDQLWLDFHYTVSEHKPRLSLKTYYHSESAFGGGY
jgi:hypothetical protein